MVHKTVSTTVSLDIKYVTIKFIEQKVCNYKIHWT